MAEAWQFTICETLDEAWARRPAVNVGGGPVYSSPDFYVLAQGPQNLRFDVRYLSEDYRHNVDVIAWQGWFVFGFGGRVILVSQDTQRHIEFNLGCYFCETICASDYLLAVSGQGIIRLNTRGEIDWRNDALGLDGIIVTSVENDVIDGNGEWDPPGGWRPFRLSLKSGANVSG